jgi:hypothetical protein
MTEQNVRELLDKAVAAATLVVAVHAGPGDNNNHLWLDLPQAEWTLAYIGALSAGHVGTWAAQCNYCWFGRGPQGSQGGGQIPCAVADDVSRIAKLQAYEYLSWMDQRKLEFS